MNKQDYDIMNILLSEPFINQRILSESSGYSLGAVNRSIKKLCSEGFFDEEMTPTKKAIQQIEMKKPKNAIIVAAGYGMRMVPINTEVPKGLLEIQGEPLIERLIKQLHEADINEIYVVVGYMKEKYEYLIDVYGVKLVVNMEYSKKNNLSSLSKVLTHLSNSYIVPCDIWCSRNPFHRKEFYSWYLVSEEVNNESSVRVNRKAELVSVSSQSGGNAMIGICYLLEEQAQVVRERIKEMSNSPQYDKCFWEEALMEKGKMCVWAKVAHVNEIVEINTYEQLRDFDEHSEQLQTEVLTEAAKALQTEEREITDIQILKKGMTNRSFLFKCKNQKYIMRIPGEGTDRLINRAEEAEVYETIDGLSICDEIIYLNSDKGFKITKYIENAHTCDSLNWEEVRVCMEHLKRFHEKKLKVQHTFSLFGQIQYYEDLWKGQDSIYKDYFETKKNVFSLKRWIDQQPKQYGLTHIDAVPDNFLFANDENKNQKIYLIDWEYAGMQDPHVDIAMFGIYALYDRKQMDQLIDLYFENKCPEIVRVKIYAYVAVCGLLWSNWCEYKRNLGVEFGEYALYQYRYAKEYYRIVKEYLRKEKENV